MEYRKLIWAVIGAMALGLQTGLPNGMNSRELLELAALILGAIGTWLLPNTTVLATAKTWVNGLLAGIAILITLLDGGITGPEWATVVIAVLTTAGVYVAPGAPLYVVPRGGLPPAVAA